MTGEEIRNEFAIRDAVRTAFLMVGMRLLPNAEVAVLEHMRGLGVTASIAKGYLELQQGTTDLVINKTCETIRQQMPQLFASDPHYDTIASREDFHGSPSEIAKAKAAYVSKWGLAAWERLPATRAEAERRAVTPSADMNRAQYVALPFSEKSKLAGILGAEGIRRIMSRTR